MTSPIHIDQDQGGTEAFSAALKSIAEDHTRELTAVVCSLTEDECRLLQALVFKIEDYLHDRVQVFDEEFFYETR